MSFALSVVQKEKFGCKLKKLRSSLAKSRAESALTVFELRDENGRLQEENTRLSGEAGVILSATDVLAVYSMPTANVF